MRVFVLMFSFALSACSLNPLAETKPTKEFADRAIEINEAYAAERNAQILINVLRARDDLPRKYTSLSELKITPSSSNSTSASAAGVKLGNNGIDPWATLGGERSQTNSSNLELAVSPKVSGAGDQSVFRSAVAPEMFEYYLTSPWDDSLVKELMIEGSDLFYSASSSPENTATLQRIIDANSDFEVYSGGGRLVHCFQPADCISKIREVTDPSEPFDDQGKRKDINALVIEPTSSASVATVGSLADRSSKTTLDVSKEGEKFPKGVIGDGVFLYCTLSGLDQIMLNTSSVSGAALPDKDESVWTAQKYQCSRTPSSETFCEKKNMKTGECGKAIRSTPAVFWVETGKKQVKEDGQVGAKEKYVPQAVYQVRLRAVDDIIYYVGKLIRNNQCESGMVGCSSTKYDTSGDGLRGPLFAIATEDSLKPSGCAARFAASVRYSDGVRYFAGPPEVYRRDSSESERDWQSECRYVQRTGTVLTLISELIEVVEVPPDLPVAGIAIR